MSIAAQRYIPIPRLVYWSLEWYVIVILLVFHRHMSVCATCDCYAIERLLDVLPTDEYNATGLVL